MAFHVERFPLSDVSNNNNHLKSRVSPYVQQRKPWQNHLTLIIITTVIILILLSNVLLGYYYYRQILFPAIVSSVELPVAGDLLQILTLNDEEKLLTQLYEVAELSVVKVIVVKKGQIDLTQERPRGDGLGTGVIFDDQGHIVTNRHVVNKASDVAVQLADGRVVGAIIVGQDPGTDLAVLDIDVAAEELSVATFSDSDSLQVGQVAIAIGYPFGLDKSLTVGHVSGLNRMTPSKDKYTAVMEDMIQTDVAINPGNSGGPLLNLQGEVVGINTTFFSFNQGWQGISFAIPGNIVRRVSTELIEKGYVSRPFLGVVGLSLNAERAKRLNLKVEQGLLIQEIAADSPASELDLKAGKAWTWLGKQRIRAGGDILLTINGQVTDSMKSLSKVLEEQSIGDTLTLSIQRDGQEMELTVILAERAAAK